MIVLDTHIWLWWINEDVAKLGSVRKEPIESSDTVAVSAIRCFEVAWLDSHGRIELSVDRITWFERALEGSDVTLLSITPQIANIKN